MVKAHRDIICEDKFPAQNNLAHTQIKLNSKTAEFLTSYNIQHRLRNFEMLVGPSESHERLQLTCLKNGWLLMSLAPAEPAPSRCETTGWSRPVTSDRISASDDLSRALARPDSGKESGVCGSKPEG